MTRPIYEQSTERDIESVGYRAARNMRRPNSASGQAAVQWITMSRTTNVTIGTVTHRIPFLDDGNNDVLEAPNLDGDMEVVSWDDGGLIADVLVVQINSPGIYMARFEAEWSIVSGSFVVRPRVRAPVVEGLDLHIRVTYDIMSASLDRCNCTGVFVVTQDDIDDKEPSGRNLIFGEVFQASGSNQTLDIARLDVWRLSAAAAEVGS